MTDLRSERTTFMKTLLEKMMKWLNVEELDEETTRMTERVVVLRISTKHINLWMRQLEMKRKAVCELAKLMGLETIQNEFQKEKSLEKWGKRTSNHFPKSVRRMLYGEIDNMVWSEKEKEISQWCKTNKVFDEITEKEIEEIWDREGDDDEEIRLNWKYVENGQESV